MSTPNCLWLTPHRFNASTYAVKIIANGVTDTRTFPSTGSLDQTRDYWVSGDGKSGLESDGITGAADLVAMLQATIRTHAQCASATVTISNSTFKVTLANGTSVQILWSDAATTLDPTIFGWKTATDSIAGTSCTAPNVPKGIWRPRRAVVGGLVDRQPVVAATARAISGKRRSARLAAPYKERPFEFAFLQPSVAHPDFAASDAPYATFEQAWIDAISLGRVWRHYDDESRISLGAYKLYSATKLKDLPLREPPKGQFWWNVVLPATLELNVAFTNSYSIRLPTASDFITYGDPTIFDGATRCSWSLWVKKDVLDTHGLVWYKAGSSSTCWVIQCFTSEVRVFISNAGSDAQLTNTGTLLTAGAWAHIGVVFDGFGATNADKIKLYVNGVLASGTFGGAAFPTSLRTGTTSLVTIGGAAIGYLDCTATNVDELAAFVGVSLTAAQMQSLASRPSDVRTVATPQIWIRGENNYTDTMGLLTPSVSGSPSFSASVP